MVERDIKQLAMRLLDWNRRHLTRDSELAESDIAEVFAANFVVKANGRTYQADHRVYREFLDGFRSTIQTIDYDVEKIVVEARRAVLVMDAKIVRDNGKCDRFSAMLLLEFDARDFISWWQEVYVPLSPSRYR